MHFFIEKKCRICAKKTFFSQNWAKHQPKMEPKRKWCRFMRGNSRGRPGFYSGGRLTWSLARSPPFWGLTTQESWLPRKPGMYIKLKNSLVYYYHSLTKISIINSLMTDKYTRLRFRPDFWDHISWCWEREMEFSRRGKSEKYVSECEKCQSEYS